MFRDAQIAGLHEAIQAGKFDDKIRLFVPDKAKLKAETSSFETTGSFDLSTGGVGREVLDELKRGLLATLQGSAEPHDPVAP